MVSAREVIKYTVFPPLLLFKPHTKAQEQAKHDLHAHHSHHHHHPAAAQGQQSAFWPIFSIAMVLITMYRFSEEEEMTQINTKNLLVGPFKASAGSEAYVWLFWTCLLLALTWTLYLIRPAHVHGISHLLIPEIVALGLFFIADFSIGVIRIVDSDGDFLLTEQEIRRGIPLVVKMIPARWLQVNIGLALSATIVQTTAPEPYSKEAIVYNVCWSVILAQAVSYFLFSSNRRGEDLEVWGSTFAALIYGPSLYFYTHGIALVSAVVFHKHTGANHPPTLAKVVHVLSKADPLYTLQILAFGAALAVANVLPAMLDHRTACSPGSTWGPTVLEACSKGLLAGPLLALTMSAINIAALIAALRIFRRKVEQAPKPSYESALTWTTGCLATFCWCELAMPGREKPAWKLYSALLGTVAHFVVAAVSADSFSGRLEPTIKEAIVMTFWAATQCFQGLALEHHAATKHHGHDSLSVHGLLIHLGEFGLCEFGLITTLAWFTSITEEIVETLPLKGRGGLGQPLLGKKH